MNYPEEWSQLSKVERKKKIRAKVRQENKKVALQKKITNISIGILLTIALFAGFKFLLKEDPEQIEFKQKVKSITLDGKVEEFPIEGRDHLPPGTKIEYQTNPPTSGGHLAQAKNWGVYNKEIDDMMAIHGLEHGGIWISYKDIDEESIKILKEIGKSNPQSVIVSKRLSNDNKIVITSWGKMMRLELVDKALIQKYINTYKNQSPEKLAL